MSPRTNLISSIIEITDYNIKLFFGDCEFLLFNHFVFPCFGGKLDQHYLNIYKFPVLPHHNYQNDKIK